MSYLNGIGFSSFPVDKKRARLIRAVSDHLGILELNLERIVRQKYR